MTNEEILKKAIEKATKNGYEYPFTALPLVKENHHAIVFSHDFAKAFWGEETQYKCHCKEITDMPIWKYRLQQMVLEENPIKYLEKFIKENK